MAIAKVQLNESGVMRTLIDLTGDTVTADDMLQGVTAHGPDGEVVTGTIRALTNAEIDAIVQSVLGV